MKAGGSTKVAMLYYKTTGYLYNLEKWAKWFWNGVPNIAQVHTWITGH